MTSCQVIVRMDTQMRDRIRARAERNHRTMSGEIRRAIEAHMFGVGPMPDGEADDSCFACGGSKTVDRFDGPRPCSCVGSPKPGNPNQNRKAE